MKTKTPTPPTSIDGALLERFRSAVYGIANAKKALVSSMSLFPDHDLAMEGEVDIDIAITAFSDLIEKQLFVLVSILDGDEIEEENESRKGGA